MEEPSVLDYLKSILNPWQKNKIQIPESGSEKIDSDDEKALERPLQDEYELREQQTERHEQPQVSSDKRRTRFPWLILLAVMVAISAQSLLEPPDRNLGAALAGYSLAVVLTVFFLTNNQEHSFIIEGSKFSQIRINGMLLIVSFGLAFFTFLAFGTHRFGVLNLFLWLSAIFTGIFALWQPGKTNHHSGRSLLEYLRKSGYKINITPWSVLLVLAAALVIFFRFYRLGQVPGEMFSDHAEKLNDISDVLNGNYWIFFPRNTGREAIQMYLTAAVALIFNTGLSFISLKIGTALAGFLTLPFIYLAAKEIGNRWTGLLAFVFAGIAYWPNVISRIGLRFPLYPLFVAPVFYFLIRGLLRSRWNGFLLAGLALGVGLHGYSPIRFLPFVITAGVLLYLIHPQSRGNRKQVVFAYLALAFIAFLIFLPLFRYWVDDPTMFSYRMMTRMGTVERQYPGPVLLVFFENVWEAIIMFFWDNGSIWVHSVTGRPALSVVSAGLFLLSVVFLLIRYIRKPNWLDSFLVLSIPLLMMPSILSLAFPDENPSLNRSGGAVIPVFIMIAVFLERVLSSLANWRNWQGKASAFLLGVFLLLLTCNQEYDLVFRQFDQQFMSGAWNTSEIGGVIRGYVDSSIGNRDSAYVVPYPHWVDTRLVGINAGYPEKDYALWPDHFEETLSQTGAKLFLIKLEDQQSILDLKALYPSSSYWLYQSKMPGKEFWVFMVPPDPSVGVMSQPEAAGE